MTCREKLKIERPEYVGEYYVGGCCGCPSVHGYLDDPECCNPTRIASVKNCTACWDREIPGTEKTKDRDMELNEKFAKMTFAELVDTAAGYEKEIEELKQNLEHANEFYHMAVNDRVLFKGQMDAKDKKIVGLQDTIDIIEREKTTTINKLNGEIEKLKDIIESKNGRIGTMNQKIANYERDIRCLEKEKQNLNEKNELLLKDNQYVRDNNRLADEKYKERIESLKARLKVFEDEWSELKEKNESLEKDVSNYRDIIAMRDQRLNEKEADIHNLRETVEFYERHTSRIEGELKLYKGMKVDTNKTDYTTKPEKVEPLCKYVPSNRVIGTLESAIIEEEGIRATILLTEEAAERFMPNGRLPNLGSDIKVDDFVEPAKLRTMPDIDEMHEYKGHNDPVGEPGEPGIPICTTVPSSAVIGKIHCLKANWVVDEEPHVVFKLPKDAVKKLTGKDNWSNIDYLIMPTDMYKDVLNKDLEEHMKRYRDMINQYKYYSRVLDNPCLNITPDHNSNPYNSNPIPPVAKDYKAIGEHIHRKFAALMDAGFTEDQAMQLIPIWTDDEEN